MTKLAEIAEMAAENAKADTLTSTPAKVVKRVGGFVDVLPMTKRHLDAADGSIAHEALPIVPNLPIAFPSANGVSVTWPVAPGSFGLILHTTYSLAEFRRTGDVSEPGDLRMHHLAHGVFLPLFCGPDSGVASTVDDPALVVEAASIKLGANANEFLALANLVQTNLNNIKLALDSIALAAGTTNPYVTVLSVAATKVKGE